MRVLLVHKFFYANGGDSIHFINLIKLLEEHGHEVAVFAMQHPDNLPTPYAKYFPSNVDFNSIRRAVPAMLRLFGCGVKRRFEQLLADFRPEVVHLHNIHSQLSPIVARIAHKEGIRVVWTLHDYKLACPAYTCLCKGKVCEACFREKQQVVLRRCMKSSLIASLMAYMEARCWVLADLVKWTDMFICPSNFMRSKMLEAGIGSDKMQVLCNYTVQSKRTIASVGSTSDAYAYIGRISYEKGVETMLKAAAALPSYTLYIAGTGGEYANELKCQYAEHKHIVWLGWQDREQIAELLNKVAFTIAPSEWYENNPLSIIESLSAGVPVLGARIGGIPELIDEGKTGITFKSGDEKELRAGIIYLMQNRLDSNGFGINTHSPEMYYKSLMTIYAGE